MDWMKQIGHVLDRYSDARADRPVPEVDSQFDEVARVAPKDALADGLAAAFRSDQTPPFPHMLSQLFARSSGSARAGILQQLALAAGPAVLARILRGRTAVRDARDISPEAAQDVSPQDVEELAAEAEKREPSIIDRMSRTYAEQPQIVKALGAGALTLALAHLASRQHARR